MVSISLPTLSVSCEFESPRGKKKFKKSHKYFFPLFNRHPLNSIRLVFNQKNIFKDDKFLKKNQIDAN